MNRNLSLVWLVWVLFALCGCGDKYEEMYDPNSKPLVLIDTDMVEGFDDGVALMMLLKDSNIGVVGVTTVTGNTWAQEGAAYAIRQIEICGSRKFPVIPGADFPLREGRLESLRDEVEACPGVDHGWLGALEYDRVTDWYSCYTDRYGEQPTFSATQRDAADFIVRTLHAHPGKITLLAIGPCTNIANALLQDPDVAFLAKEIVYMAGSYFTEGNTTPYAEFNAIFDPEALAICFRAPFKRQTIVGLDVCNTIRMDKQRYDDMCARIKDERLLQIFHNCFHYADFQSNPQHQTCIWDVISAAAVMDDAVVSDYRKVRVDVQDNPALPEYGRTFATNNPNCQYARVVTAANADRIWQLVYRLLD